MDTANLIQTVAIYALPVPVALTVHEAAHGLPAPRSCSSTARRPGRLTRNPAALVEHRSPRTPEVDPLTADAIAKTVAACHTSTETARCLVGTALGLRQGEARRVPCGAKHHSTGRRGLRRRRRRPVQKSKADLGKERACVDNPANVAEYAATRKKNDADSKFCWKS